MTNKNAPIGVFDSGVGGLTVMKSCTRFPMKRLFILEIQQEFHTEINQKIPYCGFQGRLCGF